MDLIYGIIIGLLFAISSALAVAVYFLYGKINKNYADFAEVRGIVKLELKPQIEKVREEYAADKLTINDNFDNYRQRLQKLENIEVPEHLTFTQEQTIKKEVSERLAKNTNFSDINFLEVLRDAELAEYNREYHQKG